MGNCCGGRGRSSRTTTGRAGDSTVIERSYLRFYVGDEGYDTLAEARAAADAAGVEMEMRRVPR